MRSIVPRLSVTGGGNRAFCAGADIKELMGRSLTAQREGAAFGPAVFAKLVRDIRHYEPSELPFATWILRFAAKVVNSEEVTRRRSAADRFALAGPGEDPENGGSPPLHKALRRLPDDQRRVLVLRYIAGLSTTEIAERLDSSEVSVRELHENGSRALQADRVDAPAANAD